jgi:hypothetical protein
MRRPTSVVWKPVPPLMPVIALAVSVTPAPVAALGVSVVVVVFAVSYGPSVKVRSESVHDSADIAHKLLRREVGWKM